MVWSVASEGFLFARPPEHDSFKNIRAQFLLQLLDEGRANIAGDLVIIPHDIIATLRDDERMALELPEPFPFTIEIKASDNLGSRDFKYIYHFLDVNSRPFMSAERVGAHLTVSPDYQYLLMGDLYWLLETIDDFNARDSVPLDTHDAIKDNLLVFAKVKNLAERTGAILDMYLKREQVVAPTKIAVHLRRSMGGEIEIEPVLCDTNSGKDSSRATPLSVLDDTQQEEFIKVFDRLHEVRDLYPVPNGPRIVLSEPVRDSLRQFKHYRRVSGKEKDLLLKNPELFFDTSVVDLEGFSERVIEIGEYQPRVFPFLRPAKEPWLPPEGGLVMDDQLIHIQPQDIPQLKMAIQDALNSEQTQVNWKGNMIRANEETLKSLDTLAEMVPFGETGTQEALDQYVKMSGSKKILLIKDNFEEAIFLAGRQVRPGTLRLPHSLRKDVELFKHQNEGLLWLENLWTQGARGALLADDMGLGKTLQVLMFMAWVAEMMEDRMIPRKPMLIVAPVALLENWKNEYCKFLTPILGPFLEVHGANLNRLKKLVNRDVTNSTSIEKEIDPKQEDDTAQMIASGRGLLLDRDALRMAGAVLTTYETLRDYQFSFGLIDWAVMILDESQRIKTPGAMITLATKAMKYDFGICLTGTPVENSLVDIWSIMDFVQPGHLRTLKEFVAKYQNPLRKEGTDLKALGRELKEQIDGLLKRRMKEDIMGDRLPEKVMHVYPVRMPPQQLDKYLEVIKKARTELPAPVAGKRRQHIFQVIAALRDISLHPYISLPDHALAELPDEEIIQSSARLAKTMEILEEIRNRREKVIIFLVNRKLQRVLQRLLMNRFNIACFIVNGEVLGRRRQEMVDTFQQSKGFNVIIMSPEAAGVGLNVTAANHVIHLSREWNPAKEDQATDRVYRIGQVLPVHVHIPLAVHPIFGEGEGQGTFDLKLHRLLETKRELSRSVLMPSIIEESEIERLGEELISAADCSSNVE